MLKKAGQPSVLKSAAADNTASKNDASSGSPLSSLPSTDHRQTPTDPKQASATNIPAKEAIISENNMVVEDAKVQEEPLVTAKTETSKDANASKTSDITDKQALPITEAIIDYLTENNFSYYRHQLEDWEDTQTPPIKGEEVQNISMAMRFYDTKHESEGNVASEDRLAWLEAQEAAESIDNTLPLIEWGCVIRIHEHTQLVAVYGILPFTLPPSHLSAGMTLTTQLNYDMVLGNIEIDIRDGEIRYKNALDMEPVLASNNGTIPPQVLNYLFKSVMASTTAFAPIFDELVRGDPAEFELETVLDRFYSANPPAVDIDDNVFYVISDRVQ